MSSARRASPETREAPHGEGIESRIASIVGRKKALFDGHFDGSSDAVNFEGGSSFLAKLQEALEAEPVPLAEAAEPQPDEPDVSDTVAPVSAAQSQFMAGVTMQRLPDGRLVLEARPEVAAVLASVCEGIAAMLKQQAQLELGL
jgi:hypothetical protein